MSRFSGRGTKVSRFAGELDLQAAAKKENMSRVPGWLLDKIAEEKLTGGYDVNDICPCTFVAHPTRGRCEFEDEHEKCERDRQ